MSSDRGAPVPNLYVGRSIRVGNYSGSAHERFLTYDLFGSAGAGASTDPEAEDGFVRWFYRGEPVFWTNNAGAA